MTDSMQSIEAIQALDDKSKEEHLRSHYRDIKNIYNGNGVLDDIVTKGPWHDVRAYGAVGDGVVDDYQAIQDAIDAAKAENGTVFLPRGTYLIKTGLLIDGTISFWGQGRLQSIIQKSGNIVGITINGGQVDLKSFQLNSAGGADASVGIYIQATSGDRSILTDLYIWNQGSHGILMEDGNLTSFTNIRCRTNGGDGIKFDGDDCNGCSLYQIDLLGNSGAGLNFENGGSNFGFGVVCQNNAGNGITLNDRQNIIFMYGEKINASGSDVQIEFTSGTNAYGNMIFASGPGASTENTVLHNFVESNDERNIVFGTKNQASFWPGVGGNLRIDKWSMGSNPLVSDGFAGILTLSHSATAEFTFDGGGTGQNQTVAFGNTVRKLTVTDLTTGPTVGSTLTGDTSGATMTVTASDTAAETISGLMDSGFETEFTTSDTVFGGSAAGTLTVTNVASYELNVKTDGVYVAGNAGEKRGGIKLFEGGGSNTPAYIQMSSIDGSTTYLFVTNDGSVRAGPNIPDHDEDDGYILRGTMRTVYDITGGDSGTIGAHKIGANFPDNAVITRSWYEVVTAVTSVANFPTVAIGIEAVDTAGILGPTDLSAASGFADGIQNGAATNFSAKASGTSEQMLFTIAAEVATAGKLIVWAEFIISE